MRRVALAKVLSPIPWGLPPPCCMQCKECHPEESLISGCKHMPRSMEGSQDMLRWCSIEDAASEVERKAMAVEGGGVQAERLQRSIIELRKVSVHTHISKRLTHM